MWPQTTGEVLSNARRRPPPPPEGPLAQECASPRSPSPALAFPPAESEAAGEVPGLYGDRDGGIGQKPRWGAGGAVGRGRVSDPTVVSLPGAGGGRGAAKAQSHLPGGVRAHAACALGEDGDEALAKRDGDGI